MSNDASGRPPLRLVLPSGDLARYVRQQIATVFPDGREPDARFEDHIQAALQRLSLCLAHHATFDRSRGSRGAGIATFNHLNSDHYAVFLSLLANTVHRGGGERWIAEKVYCLNKALHAIDIYFEVELPAIFMIVHGVGSVVGRATFGDYLVLYQNCTIGGNTNLEYPVLGRGVVMYAHSRVIGASRIGNNCMIASGALVMDAVVPDDSVVFGVSPNLEIRPSRHDTVSRYFAAAQ
jgi:serine O-acetyltransferase